ncbi:methionyl-tRNA formyltransferase [Kineococcus aurantiacus]|uniref:Methionyl-tRNA formyltransferase n=1 Tax=Kineococcus aurantiacus TaxID=37633 RepID=A0A7Y9J2S9_9ACTN|nr:formyltransferase family protein [Kineococcus aurantiacus]NYD24592.1 methionyl-tRNA formyltransferase [Kineococcus aurantiacus]
MAFTGRKVVLAGNNSPAIEVLRLLLERLDAGSVLAVAPTEGSKHEWQPSLADAAHAAGVRCLQPADVNDPSTIAAVREHDADLLLSVYYTQIFKAPFLAAIRGPKINFHPALLPRHRGTAPLIWAIVSGDAMAGVTAHHIDEGIDTGAPIARKPFPIHHEDTGFDLHRKATRLVHRMAADLLNDLLTGRPLPNQEVGHHEPSYHGRADARLNHLNWKDSSHRIRNIVRALAHPFPGAYVIAGAERVILERVQSVEPSADLGSRPPGSVELPHGKGPLVWTSTGLLRIETWRDGDAMRSGEEMKRFLHEGMMLR